MKKFITKTATVLSALILIVTFNVQAQSGNITNNKDTDVETVSSTTKESNDAIATVSVKYLSFNANALNKSVILNWATSEEINTNHYEVERSFTAKEFKMVGIVLDGFEDGTNKDYAFKDNVAGIENLNVIYYRLKQIGKDGTFSYSTTISVPVKSTSATAIQISPNPFTERLIVNVNSNEKATAQITIVNASGKSVATKSAIVNTGNNNLQVEGLTGLPNGTYIATVILNGKIIGSQKIVK